MQATQLLTSRFVPAIFILALLGCSKSYDPKPFTYSQLLTGTTKKTWKVTNFQLVENGQPQTLPYQGCVWNGYLGDTYTFYADAEKTMEYVHTSLCSNPEQDGSFTFKDTWYLVNANATINFPFILILYISPNLNSFNFTLKSLTATAMTIEFYDPDDNYSYRITFAALGG